VSPPPTNGNGNGNGNGGKPVKKQELPTTYTTLAVVATATPPLPGKPRT